MLRVERSELQARQGRTRYHWSLSKEIHSCLKRLRKTEQGKFDVGPARESVMPGPAGFPARATTERPIDKAAHGHCEA